MGPFLRKLTPCVCLLVLTVACATGSSSLKDRPIERPSQDSTDDRRPNYVLPLFEIVGFQTGLNLVDRRLYPDDASFDVTPASIRRNLRGPWVIDNDGFQVNQFLHPYQGAT